MSYFKILSETGDIVGCEAPENPAYVRWQEHPPMLVRCKELEAEGIISDKDNDTIYQLSGKHLIGVENDKILSAVPISEAEYDECMATHIDDYSSSDNPDQQSDSVNTNVLPSTELENRLRVLEDELAAAKILLGVSDE